MAQGGSALQVTPINGQIPEESLLAGFSTAETHKAIQDNVYVILGHGTFQRRVLYTGMLSVVALLMHALGSQLFTHDVIHWCAPPYELRDVPENVWKNEAIPLGPDGEPSQCDVYDPPIPNGEDGERRVVACDHWHYDAAEKGDSIVSRWDLVCGHVWLFKAITATHMLGAALCVPIAGVLADRVGRRPTILICVVALLCSSIGCGVSQTLTMYMASRFFVSATSCSVQLVIFILLYEVTGNERRALYGVLDTAVGTTTVPPALHFMSSLKPHWNLAHAFLSLPTALLVFWCYLLDESPSWLLAMWRMRSAERVIIEAAKTNGVDLAKARLTYKALREQVKKLEPMSTTSSFGDTFNMTATFRRRAFSVVLCWFSVNFTYYGLLERDAATEDLSVAVRTLLQAILYTMVWWHLHSHGQRETFFVMLGLLGVLLAFHVAVHFVGITALSALANCVAVSVSAVTLSVNYGYTAEVFPTIIRSLGLAASYAVGRLGVLTASFLDKFVQLESEYAVNILMAALVLLSAAALQWLPEIFVEKRKEAPPAAAMSTDELKKAIQASLSPPTGTPKQTRPGKRSRKGRKKSSRSAVSSPEDADKGANLETAKP
ncbi:hypothetical protein HPB50_005648 [Hyalomma asiaticum]|uniref:Uncharacterized protein n=1 Tax=Hyalomma asiaticum TaxID=266040 RepID=A0ACB7SID3_HYAAI|nr:hypothetical protein HPB50_005648 [Hyalomma asiaticum]